MCTNNEQDGCQPPPLPQPPIGGARSTNPEQRAICRNFIWGTCTKHSQCKFKHILDVEEMKKVLKFCHDYQNKGGCTRKDCTYLHTTREEQNLFQATGQLPVVLAERHAAMAAAAAAAAATATATSRSPMNLTNESINCSPQITPFVETFINQQPQPAPVPAPSTAVMQIQSGAQSIQSVGAKAPPPPPPPPRITVRAIQQPPPPPPPPPPPTQPSQPRPPPIPYSSPIPQIYSGNQEQHYPEFDATRPPPPLPTNIINNSNLKRKGQPENEAGPSKRMSEGVDVADSDCSICLQAEKRIEAYKEQVEKLHIEKQKQSSLCKKKTEELEAGVQVLNTLIGPQLTQIVLEHLELEEQALESDDEATHSQESQSPTYTNSTGTPSSFQEKLFIVNTLMNFMGGNSRNEPSPSVRMEDALLTALSSSPRSSNHNRLPSSNVVQALLEFYSDSNTENTQRQTAGSRTEECEQIVKEVMNADRRSSGGSGGVSNGFSQPFCNGQKTVISNAPSIAPQYFASPGVPGASGLSSLPGAPYPTFQPPPPPAGPPPPLPNVNHSFPMNGGSHPPPIRPIPITAAPGGIDFNYYGRYPNPQQYYPPYQ